MPGMPSADVHAHAAGPLQSGSPGSANQPAQPALQGSYKGHALAGAHACWSTPWSCQVQPLATATATALRAVLHVAVACDSATAPRRRVQPPIIRRLSLPTGALFIVWGIFVGYCVIVQFLASSSSKGGGGSGGRAGGGGSGGRAGGGRRRAPFRGRGWYALAAGPGRWFEPCFKLGMGLFAAGVELRFAAACNVPARLRWAPCWWVGAAVAAAAAGLCCGWRDAYRVCVSKALGSWNGRGATQQGGKLRWGMGRGGGC